MKWLTWHWYVYLFAGLRSLRQLWCRLGGHACGPIWYRIGETLEPDMRCKGCGEDLG